MLGDAADDYEEEEEVEEEQVEVPSQAKSE